MAAPPSPPALLRVLIELDSSDLRKGAIRDAIDLARAGEFGFSCTFCGEVDDSLATLLRSLGAGVERGRSRSFARSALVSYGWDVIRWARLLRRLRPDVVHLNYLGWGPSLACAAHFCGIPVVARAGGDYHAGNPSNDWIDYYVANSDVHGRSVRESPLAARLWVAGPLINDAPNIGAVEAPPPPRMPGRHRILFLGQLVDRKGIHTLVEAMPTVPASTEFMLVGGDWNDAGYPRALRERITALGLEGRVIRLNHRTDGARLMQHADLLVVPSLADALPRVIFEAMAQGLPVVASRVGGIPSLVEDGVTGLLVPPNDPAALAEALTRLIQAPELRTRLGDSARSRGAALSQHSRTLARYAELYGRAAGVRPQAAAR